MSVNNTSHFSINYLGVAGSVTLFISVLEKIGERNSNHSERWVKGNSSMSS